MNNLETAKQNKTEHKNGTTNSRGASHSKPNSNTVNIKMRNEAILKRIELLEKDLGLIQDQKNQITDIVTKGDKALEEFNQNFEKQKELDRQIEQLELEQGVLEMELTQIQEEIETRKQELLPSRGDMLDAYVEEYEELFAQIKRTRKKISKGNNAVILENLEEKQRFLYNLTEELDLPIQELEDRLENKQLLKWFMVSNFSPKTKEILDLREWGYVEEDFTPEHIDALCIPEEKPSVRNNFTIEFTLNGLMLQVLNPEQVRDNDGKINIEHPLAIFNVVGPDNKVVQVLGPDKKPIKSGGAVKLAFAENLMAEMAKVHLAEVQKAFDAIPDKEAWNKNEIKKLEKVIDTKIESYKENEKHFGELPESTKKEGEELHDKKLEELEEKEFDKEQELVLLKKGKGALQTRLRNISRKIEELNNIYNYDSEDIWSPVATEEILPESIPEVIEATDPIVAEIEKQPVTPTSKKEISDLQEFLQHFSDAKKINEAEAKKSLIAFARIAEILGHKNLSEMMNEVLQDDETNQTGRETLIKELQTVSENISAVDTVTPEVEKKDPEKILNTLIETKEEITKSYEQKMRELEQMLEKAKEIESLKNEIVSLQEFVAQFDTKIDTVVGERGMNTMKKFERVAELLNYPNPRSKINTLTVLAGSDEGKKHIQDVLTQALNKAIESKNV